MPIHVDAYRQLLASLGNVTLVAVSKTKPVEDIQALYDLGHRDFGENYVQELLAKQAALPADIRWHFIGHLQSNKVKQIAPFVHLIHGIDSLSLLHEVGKQGVKTGRRLDCLLQVHIAREETKFGFKPGELGDVPAPEYARIRGLMGMATNDASEAEVRREFCGLAELYARHEEWDTLSMGMSNDYRLALECGSNMVRIGSLIFGER